MCTRVRGKRFFPARDSFECRDTSLHFHPEDVTVLLLLLTCTAREPRHLNSTWGGRKPYTQGVHVPKRSASSCLLLVDPIAGKLQIMGACLWTPQQEYNFAPNVGTAVGSIAMDQDSRVVISHDSGIANDKDFVIAIEQCY